MHPSHTKNSNCTLEQESITEHALSHAEREALCAAMLALGLQSRTRRALLLFLSDDRTYVPHAAMREALQQNGTLSQVDSIMFNINTNIRRAELDEWVELRRFPPRAHGRLMTNDDKLYYMVHAARS